MTLPRLRVLSLGGTITMTRGNGSGITPKLGAEELAASVPGLADVAQIVASSPFRVASPSLSIADLVEIARVIRAGMAEGFAGTVVIQGTDTIEESAFLLDLLVGADHPVVVTGAMRGADAPGADGPANLLAAALTAVAPGARGQGTLAVLNDQVHAARWVQKGHTALPSAFVSPLAGPVGLVAEGRARFFATLPPTPVLPVPDGEMPPVALLRWAMGESGRLLAALPGLGYAGAVIEGMGAGHVPAEAAPLLGELAARMPVVLASRCQTGPVFTHTYGYPGAEIDLIGRGLLPGGTLSGLKARLLLTLCLRAGMDTAAIASAFAAYR